MIPDYQTIMLPLLNQLADQQEHSLQDTIEHISNQFNVTSEERRKLLPSGQQTIIHNRVGWSRTYMKKAGLIESTRRGYFRITQRGLEVLNRNLNRIDVNMLEEFPEFREFRSLKKPRTIPRVKGAESTLTPQELLADAVETLRNELADELLEQLKTSSPTLFENIVVDLLVKMGYGGSWEDAAKAIGRSGDEGIDGIINEDRLGLDVIYIQAKRWNGTVGRPEVQKFAGALMGQKARKGVFITTSNFTNDAIDYASKVETKIVLIDGNTLVNSMIDYGIGVSTIASYEIKKVDLDYFTEG